MVNSMNIQSNEQLDINEKMNLMMKDGIILDIPIESHINKLEEKNNLFTNKTYLKKEKLALEFIKALNNPNRLRILQLLKIGAKCSCELEYSLNLSQPTVSHHVNILEKAHIVQIESKGKWKLIKIVESPIIFLVLDQLKS